MITPWNKSTFTAAQHSICEDASPQQKLGLSLNFYHCCQQEVSTNTNRNQLLSAAAARKQYHSEHVDVKRSQAIPRKLKERMKAHPCVNKAFPEEPEETTNLPS